MKFQPNAFMRISVIVAALALVGPLHATTILLTDNFNESPANESASTFNDNLGTTQGGTLASVTYSVLGSNWVAQHSNGGNSLFVGTDPYGNGVGNVSLNHNFATDANAANAPLMITFNIVSITDASDLTRWAAFNIGNAQHLNMADGGVGAGILFRQNSGADAWSGGGTLGSTSWSANDLVTITLSNTAGTGSAFNGNGSKASITIGANNLGSFTLSQQSVGYLTFSGLTYDASQYTAGRFDNLSVALIPEPRAALLGSLGMLALLRRRR